MAHPSPPPYNLHQNHPFFADPSGVSNADASDLIDFADMYDPNVHLPDVPDFFEKDVETGELIWEESTPLLDKVLVPLIGAKGPMSVVEFMDLVLKHEEFGYYTNIGKKEDDDDIDWDDDLDDLEEEEGDLESPSKNQTNIIGTHGDFTTAPEISQIFGESLLIFLLTQYQALGKPSRFQIVEIGPGRGTLICDLLRSTSGKFGEFADFAEGLRRGGGVHLVEVGKGLRKEQLNGLKDLEGEHGGGFGVDGNYKLNFVCDFDVDDERKEGDDDDRKNAEQSNTEKKIINVEWHEKLSDVPTTVNMANDDSKSKPIPTFIICQEVFDALPVHSFQKNDEGLWRERLVDVAAKDDDTNADDDDEKQDTLIKDIDSQQNSDDTTSSKKKKKKPRLRFVLPPDANTAVKTLLNVDTSGKSLSPSVDDDSQPGDIIEVCPQALLLIQDIARRIEQCRGAALIIDYGSEEGSGDSIRAFHKHEQVNVLSQPGKVDVTADVDFGSLKRVVNERWMDWSVEGEGRKGEDDKSERSRPDGLPVAFGPVSQGKFLSSMGIMERVVHLIEDEKTTDEEAEDLYNALERLVLPEHMGERYKVLCVARKKDGIFEPAGFGKT